MQTPALSPLSDVQAASINATVLEGRDIGPLIPSYLLRSRYTIVSQVGTGGFGAVYNAKDTLFSHHLVAIKEMNQDGLSSRELAEAIVSFEREALLLSNLTHPNLPRIHDHFYEYGRSYIVMDYIAGDTLEDYLETVIQRLPIARIWEDDLHQQVEAVIWLPDGKSIAACGDDTIVWVWNAATGLLQRTYYGHNDWVISLACSPDGKYIASGSFDKTVQVWEVATGRQVVFYRGHSDRICSVAWLPDGSYIASASYDRTVQIWEAATGRPVYSYDGHKYPV